MDSDSLQLQEGLTKATRFSVTCKYRERFDSQHDNPLDGACLLEFSLQAEFRTVRGLRWTRFQNIAKDNSPNRWHWWTVSQSPSSDSFPLWGTSQISLRSKGQKWNLINMPGRGINKGIQWPQAHIWYPSIALGLSWGRIKEPDGSFKPGLLQSSWKNRNWANATYSTVRLRALSQKALWVLH